MAETFELPPDDDGDGDDMTSSETQSPEIAEIPEPDTEAPATASDETLAAEEQREEAADATIVPVPDLGDAELLEVEELDDDAEITTISEPSPFDRSGAGTSCTRTRVTRTR